MALIKCPECGNNVSDTAQQCIYCGYNLHLYQKELRIDQEINEKLKEYEQSLNPPQIPNLPDFPQHSDVERTRKSCRAGIIIGIIVLIFLLVSLLLGPLFDPKFWEIAGFYLTVCLLIETTIVGFLYITLVEQNSKLAEEQEKINSISEERARIQAILDDFDSYKTTKINEYRNRLIAEKQAKLKSLERETVTTRIEKSQFHQGIQCPVCNSIRYKRISTLDRTVSVGLVGLASSKIGKQYKCLDCGHLW